MDAPDERYFILENRLASFRVAHAVSKTRASNASARAPKTLRWPHKSLSPETLAKAGFFYQPAPSNPDNVVCFLCAKNLDGWRENDNPLQEHLKHSPTCGWAITAAIEAGLGDHATMHPLDPAMIEARKATFAGRWPYESKKGFKCKTKKLVEAGWTYTPSLEADDLTTCPYCGLVVEGWEPNDNPIDEHYRREPGCPFFVLINQNPAPKKPARARVARASRAKGRKGRTTKKTEKTVPSSPASASHLSQAPTTPRASTVSFATASQAAISPSQSPQLSPHAVNQPPPLSLEPAATVVPQTKRVVLAPPAALLQTPSRISPSSRANNVVAGLRSTAPWRPADLDLLFTTPQSDGGGGGDADKENGAAAARLLRRGAELTSPERRMTVEEWVYHNAGLAEQKLRCECEAMVAAFEREGRRAMQALEGLIVE